MTPTNGTATSWEPMELRYVGDVEEVMQGGINDSQGPANGKSVPSPNDPGELSADQYRPSYRSSETSRRLPTLPGSGVRRHGVTIFLRPQQHPGP
jgi:hypothetical protein